MEAKRCSGAGHAASGYVSVGTSYRAPASLNYIMQDPQDEQNLHLHHIQAVFHLSLLACSTIARHPAHMKTMSMPRTSMNDSTF